MTGIESLHMQGLPIDELLLTRETSQQIQDLAGNAMSSTVVGTCMLTALILALEYLPDREEHDAMEIDEPETDIESHIVSESLQERPLDLSTTEFIDMEKLLVDAERSRRLCICEGRFSITDTKIHLCTECGFTACEKCGGRPSHVVPEGQLTPQFENRLLPLEFESKVKSILSMRLRLDGIDASVLEALRTRKDALGVSNRDWDIWSKLVLSATEGEFRFKSLFRQEKWTINYDAPHAKLELVLDPKKPMWRIFARCPEMEGIFSRTRLLAEQLPIARMLVQPGKNALSGAWELCLPTISKFDLEVEGAGEKVPSWKRRLGYTDSATMKGEIWSSLRFTVPDEEKRKLDRDISGDYRLLENCGTAQGALHIKEEDGQPPLYFFLDQKRTGDGVNDSFVFSEDYRRLGFGEYRTVISKLTPKWRQSAFDGTDNIRSIITGQWLPIDVEFGAPIVSAIKDGVVAAPGPEGLTLSVSNDACTVAHTVLQCKVPLNGQAESVWPEGKWVEVDPIHERLTYESLAWLTERVRSFKELSTWSMLEANECSLDNCERCAPKPPTLKWVKHNNRHLAIEDPQEAAPYERALKARPSPFVTQIRLDQDGVGTLKIGVNIPTLVHRALSRLPTEGRSDPVLSWRLVTDYIPEPQMLLPFYKLRSNKADPSSEQPPNFRMDLRPEQLRSLYWMKEQESKDITPFIEEEVAESMLMHLNWRAEGKSQRAHYVRGGVLADEVGYGKTAITIGLIDSAQANIDLLKEMAGAIPVKATLIVVPSHLFKQWNKEVVKFTGNRYNVLQISNMTNMNAVTVKDIIKADIIVIMASILSSNAYLDRVGEFSGTSGKAPASSGRRFFDWQKLALSDLAEQVDHIKLHGAEFTRKRIVEAAEVRARLNATEHFVQSGRKKGKDYAAQQKAAKAGSKRRRSDEDEEDTSPGPVETELSSSDRTKKSRQSGVKDPWGLETSAVKRDWTNMKCPPFEMFHFNRMVIDEFTYIKGQIHAGLTSQKANSRWVLSGTPPLDEFSAVQTIAVFLDVHLGINDNLTGKKSESDMTGILIGILMGSCADIA